MIELVPAIRAQAHGLFVLVSYGVGQGLGTLAAGWIFNAVMSTAESPLQQWQTFWIIPLLFAVVVTVMFGFGFREKIPFEASSLRAKSGHAGSAKQSP